jgi:PAS domain S-box-containing protein
VFDRTGAVAVTALVVAAGYYVGAMIGIALRIPPTPVSPLWPPNAILLAALMLTPPRIWWVLLLAAFPAHLLSQLQGGVPLLMIVFWFISNVSQALLGATAIRLVGAERQPDNVRSFSLFNVRSFTVFVVFGAVLAPFVASFLDVGFVMMLGWGERVFWSVWRLRFFSNVLTTLAIVPAVLIAFSREERRRLARGRRIEALALLVALALVGNIVFSRPSVLLYAEPALLYAPLPLLLWAALRFGLGGVSVGVLAIVLLAIRAAMNGRGPFMTLSAVDNVLALELLMIAIALPLMLLAVLLDERRAIEGARREGEQRYQDIVESQTELICRFRDDLTLTFANDAYCRHVGASREALLGRSFMHRIPVDVQPELLRQVATLFTPARGARTSVFEHPVLRADGSRGWEVWTARPIVGPDGVVAEAQAIGRDVSEQRRAEQAVRERDEALRATHAFIQELAGRLITAQEDERRRIARELHDDVNQKLAAVAIAMSGLRRIMPDSRGVREEVTRLQDRIAGLTDDIRRLCHELHPVILFHVGLVLSLRAHCVAFARDTGIELGMDLGEEPAGLPPSIALCFYRVAQEALHNVARHSRARTARITLRQDDGVLELAVRDDGVGFEPTAVRSRNHGLGLVSIEERMRLIHGTIVIAAAPGRGVEVLARAPLEIPRAALPPNAAA